MKNNMTETTGGHANRRFTPGRHEGLAAKTEWVIQKMESWADPALAEQWDNIGLLIGDAAWEVKNILVALDATENVIDEAVLNKSDLIITHHPLIYNPIKRINADEPTGRKIIKLIQNGIGLYCAHTNLDITEGGVNDILFERLSLLNKEPLMESGLGRVGDLPEPKTLEEFSVFIKKALSLSDIRFAGSPSKKIHKIGLCAGDGSGQKYCDAALKKNCDAYITGDLRYHGITEALEKGLCLIDITHHDGEEPIIQEIASRLKSEAAKDNIELNIKIAIQERNVMSIT